MTDTQVFNKGHYIKCILSCRQMHISGHQRFDKSFSYFLVGISQCIQLEIRIISLNCEITALVEHRKRIGDSIAGRIKLFGGGGRVIQFPDIKIAFLQNIYQESGSTGRKPKIGILLLCECIEQTEWIINIFTVLTE